MQDWNNPENWGLCQRQCPQFQSYRGSDCVCKSTRAQEPVCCRPERPSCRVEVHDVLILPVQGLPIVGSQPDTSVSTTQVPAVQVDAADVIGGQSLVEALGHADQATVFAAVADVTAETPAGTVVSTGDRPGSGEATARQRAERRLIPVGHRRPTAKRPCCDRSRWSILQFICFYAR